MCPQNWTWNPLTTSRTLCCCPEDTVAEVRHALPIKLGILRRYSEIRLSQPVCHFFQQSDMLLEGFRADNDVVQVMEYQRFQTGEQMSHESHTVQKAPL